MVDQPDKFSELAAVAARVLAIPEEDARNNSRHLEHLSAYYFWEAARGGGAVVIGNDGSMLFANSSVAPEKHIDAFGDGRRTDPEAFEL